MSDTDTNTLGAAPAYVSYGTAELTALPAHELEVELTVDADGTVSLNARGRRETLADGVDILERLAAAVVERVNPAARTARAFADSEPRP